MIIDVLLDSKVFKNFTRYNILSRRKQWKSPVIFAAIMTVCAIVCFIMHHVEGAILLGSVLLCVGLGMPVVYFVTFLFSLNKQVKAQNLTPARQVYTLELTDKTDGISVKDDKNAVVYCWDVAHGAYQNKDCTYLFMTQDRAFLLPHSCVQEGKEALWALLCKMLGTERCHII